MTKYLGLISLTLISLDSFALNSRATCAAIITSPSMSAEIESILDSAKQFKDVSAGGVIFSVYGEDHNGFPVAQFPKGTRLAVQEITHAGWGWSRIYSGTIERAGGQFLFLDVGDHVKRIELDAIAGIAWFPKETKAIHSASEEIKSILDSAKVFKALAKNGVIFSVYGENHDVFPFEQFPKQTRFAVQEITHGGWGRSRIYSGTLERAGGQFLYLNVGQQVKRIDIGAIAGITLLNP